METREFHQYVMMLLVMAVFGLILDNIWISSFLWLTCFSFIFFKFKIGHIYLQNIFYGCVLYYITKKSFRREHINLFFKVFLWVVFINLAYGFIQVCGFDFMFGGRESLLGIMGLPAKLQAPTGFMGNTAVTSILYALAIPVLITRPHIFSKIAGYMLFIPLLLLHSFSSWIASIASILFVLFFRLERRNWIKVVAGMVIIGAIFTWKVDVPGNKRFHQWQLALKDFSKHPVSGYGLDSFRKYTDTKNFKYTNDWVKQKEKVNGKNAYTTNTWDNPHNLIVSILFEWGLGGLIILIGLMFYYAKRFGKSIKDANTLALAGALLTIMVVSMGQFPMFLSRFAVIIIPMVGLYEIQTA